MGMKKLLLFLLAVATLAFSDSYPSMLNIIDKLIQQSESNALQMMLKNDAATLSDGARHKVLTALECTKAQHVEHKPILLIIDYSIPSSEKRLWVFDLANKKLLFNTYVSHGIGSGTLLSSYFSNINNSKASSIGVYKTEETYYGRDGLSLRLEGLERNFNSNANGRYLVIHGGWYMDENFIKKYGRPGRSWGCPALPLALTQPIIDTIKDGALFVAYYPSEDWFVKSRFLNCQTAETAYTPINTLPEEAKSNEPRESILYVNRNHSYHHENDPILVISASAYKQIFQTTPPLSRMLRRQIQNEEYIAISNNEFDQIIRTNNHTALHDIYFVIPEIKMVRGYYETKMQIVPHSTIKSAQHNIGNYSLTFDAAQSPTPLGATNEFIRWVGL